MSRLKNCPFCGSNNVHAIEAKTENGEHTFSVCCMDCNIGIFRPNFDANEFDAYASEHEARSEWNRRHE